MLTRCCVLLPLLACVTAVPVREQAADMNHELQSEAIDLIVSAIDKQRGNYEVSAAGRN